MQASLLCFICEKWTITNIRTSISSHFVASSLLGQSFPPHSDTLSVHQRLLLSRQTSSHSPILFKTYLTTRCFQCNLLYPPSLFPPPSNPIVPITSTILPTSNPRSSNVTAFWGPFQSFPHFLEELFRIELICFHFFFLFIVPQTWVWIFIFVDLARFI